jgi:histidine triad (HIT) family protein
MGVSMQDSVFTKIIKGEIPSHKIYEDELTLAFMDIHPVQPGHVLVIPKQQIEFVWDLPDDLYQAVMLTSKKVALKMLEVLPQTYIHERIVGTDVPHAHVGLIPFNDTSELKVEPDMNAEPNHKVLAEIAAKLRIQS